MHQYLRFVLYCTLGSILYSCAAADDLASRLEGKWQMVGVRIYNQDASPQLNPTGDRWLAFRAEGTFTSGSGDEQENAGTYVFKSPEQTLHMDSDAGPGDDSNWRISFRKDTLLMRGIGTERQEQSEVVLVR